MPPASTRSCWYTVFWQTPHFSPPPCNTSTKHSVTSVSYHPGPATQTHKALSHVSVLTPPLQHTQSTVDYYPYPTTQTHKALSLLSPALQHKHTKHSVTSLPRPATQTHKAPSHFSPLPCNTNTQSTLPLLTPTLQHKQTKNWSLPVVHLLVLTHLFSAAPPPLLPAAVFLRFLRIHLGICPHPPPPNLVRISPPPPPTHTHTNTTRVNVFATSCLYR